MTVQTELTDLLASAPAAYREAIDRASAAAAGTDWAEAGRLLDAIPPGYTSWHERLADVRERIDDADTWGDPDFAEQFEDY